MKNANTFGDVVEIADHLSLDEKEELVEVIAKRASIERRSLLLKEVRESDNEYRSGNCRVATPDELMREILS